ncbi:MAG: hypothetical protein ACP5N2_04060 [Candidatus Nanoarchaeia archaeon]
MSELENTINKESVNNKSLVKKTKLLLAKYQLSEVPSFFSHKLYKFHFVTTHVWQ